MEWREGGNQLAGESCLFCKIVKKELPAALVHEDAQVVAFRDIQPQAPVHVLIVPRKHIPTIADITAEDEPLLGHIHRVVRDLAEKEGIAGEGYRVVVNCREAGMQSIFHVHFHLLGGRRLGWPPG